MLNTIYTFISSIDYIYWIYVAIRLIKLFMLCIETISYFTINYSVRNLYHFIVFIVAIFLKNTINIFNFEIISFGISDNLDEYVTNYFMELFTLYEHKFHIYNSAFSYLLSTFVMIYICYKKTKKIVETIKEINKN